MRKREEDRERAQVQRQIVHIEQPVERQIEILRYFTGENRKSDKKTKRRPFAPGAAAVAEAKQHANPRREAQPRDMFCAEQRKAYALGQQSFRCKKVVHTGYYRPPLLQNPHFSVLFWGEVQQMMKASMPDAVRFKRKKKRRLTLAKKRI